MYGSKMSGSDNWSIRISSVDKNEQVEKLCVLKEQTEDCLLEWKPVYIVWPEGCDRKLLSSIYIKKHLDQRLSVLCFPFSLSPFEEQRLGLWSALCAFLPHRIHYPFLCLQEFLRRFASIPDMLELDHLTVSGDVTFGKGVSLKVSGSRSHQLLLFFFLLNVIIFPELICCDWHRFSLHW